MKRILGAVLLGALAAPAGAALQENPPSYPRTAGEIKAILGALTGKRGSIPDEFIARLQQYRFLCGVPFEDLAWNPEQAELAYFASFLCAKLDRLSHEPPRPPGVTDREYERGRKGAAECNLFAGRTSPRECVDGWMDDSDARNIARVIFPRNTKYTTPAHQDYIHIQGTEETWTAWFPLGDCSKELGSLAILPRSHVFGILPTHTAYGAGGQRAEFVAGQFLQLPGHVPGSRRPAPGECDQPGGDPGLPRPVQLRAPRAGHQRPEHRRQPQTGPAVSEHPGVVFGRAVGQAGRGQVVASGGVGRGKAPAGVQPQDCQSQADGWEKASSQTGGIARKKKTGCRPQAGAAWSPTRLITAPTAAKPLSPPPESSSLLPFGHCACL